MWYWIIYSSFSRWNKPWLVTRWQTWHVQIPETCLFYFIGLLRVWLFSRSCTCELHLSANASASLPELVTGRISKTRHLQMLGYQKWIPVLDCWGFHLVKDCGTWQGGGSGYSHMIAYLHEKEWQASQDLAAAWLTRTEQPDLWKCWATTIPIYFSTFVDQILKAICFSE